MNISYFVSLFCMIILFQLPCFVSLIILYPFYYFTKNIKFLDFPFYLLYGGVRLYDRIFIGMEYFYEYELDLKKRYVFMPNHHGFIDGILAGELTFTRHRKTASVVIHYAKYIPFYGFNMWCLGLPVLSKTKKTSVTDFMINYLYKNEDSELGIFPEGHRMNTKHMDYDTIKTGGFVIAKSLGKDVVPICHNTIDRMNDFKKEYNPYNRTCCISGTPITTENKSIEEIKKEYYEQMCQLEKILENKINGQ